MSRVNIRTICPDDEDLCKIKCLQEDCALWIDYNSIKGKESGI
jgi:hypothetical protein